MVIKELLEEYKENLLEPLIILSKLLDVDKSYIYTHVDKELDKEIVDKFKTSMKKLNDGYPIHYILEERDFMGLDLIVEDGVLIPRSDTEVLVEYLIEYIDGRKMDIFEIGIGSGAISVSLAYHCKNLDIIGGDISDKAIEVGRKNIEKFNLENIEFIKSDIFKGVQGKKFDVVVSNPPYIQRDVIETLDRNVKDYEPMLALDGGESGLDFYEKITRESLEFLKELGILIFEIGYDQGNLVSGIFLKNGFKNVKVLKDLQGHDRVVLGFLESR